MTKVIFFDFDGVIIDSMAVRDIGFEIIAKKVLDSKEIIDKFIAYHRYNAGLSRYVKIRYLYEQMLGLSITEEEVNIIASEFSNLMREKLIDKKYLIDETVEFIKSYHEQTVMHIVSGSDEKELNYLCKELGIAKYFKTIEGSPTPKNDLVMNILKKYDYNPKESILIGDSINDFDAANINGIKFYGYNNIDLKDKDEYIKNFNSFKL
ncbi:HAD family hydrolase [Aliarcobacter thereius]|uniref:phosphoglycolate phosphatase n=1 Tax=Aliarcobacter thereius TaxID=544718 RepID=A0A5R9H606_9BACT|nr:HAD family hydrolase [Aliarcobacter thereius]TLS71836.1 HAD family hydrolase [Aliarcobacter thereius]